MSLPAVVPVVCFFLLNSWTVFLGRRKFGVSMPVTLMTATLLMYFDQMCLHSFDHAFWIIAGIAVLAVPMLIFKLRDASFRELILSEGFWCCICVAAAAVIMDHGRVQLVWDEFSHWGKMVKEMIRLDSFYSEEAANLLVHKDYPPMFPIFELLWCRLTGGYSEAAMTCALHFLELMLVVPFMCEQFISIGRRVLHKIANALLMIVIMVLVITMFDTMYIFTTVMVDIAMILVFTYAVSIILDPVIRRSRFGETALIVTASFLMLSKQMGAAFLMLITLLYVLFEFNSEDTKPFRSYTSGTNIIRVCKCLALFVIPLAASSTWTRYIARLGLGRQFSVRKDWITESVRILLLGQGAQLKRDILNSYMTALFTVELSTGTVKLTFVSAIVLAICILVILYLIFRDGFGAKTLFNLIFMNICGFLGYSYVMLLIYLNVLGGTDPTPSTMDNFDRYMGTYLMAVYVIIAVAACRCLAARYQGNLDPRILLAVFAGCLILLDSSRLAAFLPQTFQGDPFRGYRETARMIEEHSESRDRIFIASNYNIMTMYFLNYYAEDRRMDDRYLYSDVALADINDSEYWTEAISCISEDDYLYVYDGAENIDPVLGRYVDTGVLEEYSLYQVVHNDAAGGAFTLVKVSE